jgi:hypothetical protein
MYAEYGEAVGNPDDKCEYGDCPKKGKVDAGDYMVEVGLIGRRFHVSCYRKLRRKRK